MWLTVHRHRTARLLHTVAARLRKHSARLGEFHAWNKCLNHLLALAEAHIECVLLETFQRAVRDCSDPDCRASLKVCTCACSIDHLHVASWSLTGHG